MRVACPKESTPLDPLERCTICDGVGLHDAIEDEPGNEGGKDPSFDKQTNPKDAIGATKLPLHLIPSSAMGYLSLAFLEGACKYGKYNWRVAGVRATIYADAAERHLKKWLDGEDSDPKTGVSHLASVMACCAIIIDAACVGKLTDDRPPRMATGRLYDDLIANVSHLKELFKDYDPVQWTEERARGHERAKRRVLSEVSREPEGEEAEGGAEQGTPGHGEGGPSEERGRQGSEPQEGLVKRGDQFTVEFGSRVPKEEPQLQAGRKEPPDLVCADCDSYDVTSDPRTGACCRRCGSREIRYT